MKNRIKWTPLLVHECRNRDFVPFRKMSAAAKWLMSVNFDRLEVYTECDWIPSWRTGMCGCDPRRAYRIPPSWNPLMREAVRV